VNIKHWVVQIGVVREYFVRFQAFKAASMSVCWDVAPCSLAETGRRSKGAYYFITRAMMEAAGTSETSVNFYQTPRRYNPADSHLRRELGSEGIRSSY
jgi:hypothetical protein